jgi:uncharacterized membrane protein YhaH (DUF805 family)
MITSFLIATLILFCLNIVINLITFGATLNSQNDGKISQIGIAIVIYLILITWNIIALASV